MTPDQLEKYIQLGVAGILAYGFVYVFIFYIKITAKQRERDQEIQEKHIVALDNLSVNAKANTEMTLATKTSMDSVKKTLEEHNDFVKDYIRVGGGGGRDNDGDIHIT